MGRLRELMDLFLKQLAEPLSKHGFKYRSLRQHYYRITSTGKDFLHIAFITHHDNFDITADFAVRNDAIEDLINYHLPNYIITKDKKWTVTVGAQLGNVANLTVEERRERVATEEDIPRALAGIIAQFETIALPCYSRFSSLESILAIASGDGKESRLFTAGPVGRAQVAFAGAYILRDKRLFEELEQRKMSLLQETKDLGVQDAINFAETLKSLW
jgi:hypothetical protein